jgi:hypothetical protein
MERIQARFVGVELYFDDLELAKGFYIETLDLDLPRSKSGTMLSSIAARGLLALSGKGLSRTPRKIKRFSSLRCRI